MQPINTNIKAVLTKGREGNVLSALSMISLEENKSESCSQSLMQCKKSDKRRLFSPLFLHFVLCEDVMLCVKCVADQDQQTDVEKNMNSANIDFSGAM